MPQAVWVGELGFGLVNIPIKLYTATAPKRVRFHQYEARTGRRIQYRRVAEGRAADHVRSPTGDETGLGRPIAGAPPPEEDESSRWGAPTEPEGSPDETEVPWEEIVKGYEVEPGHVVTLDTEEFHSVAPERSRMLEVEQFVDLDDIDPVHFEKSYYVVPQRSAVSERSYWLLYRAMEGAGKVAIGRFVMRTKEYLVAVRPAEHVLMLETLFYPDEVRDPKELRIPSVEEPSERELGLARQFLDTLAGKWEPGRQRDEHRERLLDLIHSKLGSVVTLPETDVEAPVTPITDLMEALKASVEAARRARQDEDRRTG
jgi:DNA end-binding protein Ku